MSDQDVQTIREGYEAFNRQDTAGVLERFDSEIEWHEPGGAGAPKGTFRGGEAVMQGVFSTVPASFAEFRAEAEQYIDAGEHVAVVGRFRGRTKRGVLLDAPFVHVYTMRNGKAVRFYNHVDAAAWAKAWGG